MNFVEMCIHGRVSQAKLSDYIEMWRNGTQDDALHRFLGLEWNEFVDLLSKKTTFEGIINARHHKKYLDSSYITKVRILKPSHNRMWFDNHVDELFPLIREDDEYFYVRTQSRYSNVIPKSDQYACRIP